MGNNLEIISKDCVRLDVWVNIPNKTIRFNSEEVKMQPIVFSSPEYPPSDNQHRIYLTYGMDRKSEREEDIEKLRAISTITIRSKKGWPDAPACFLYLHFPKNTRIAVANYEQD